jgi:hypothetical protein
MKINIKFILTTVLILSIKSFAQTNFTTNQITNPNILPPEVSSFQKVNFLPVSNYTGRANIDIPFYEIDLEGLKIPIRLSYNTGGIKVNEVASSTGLGWSLSAGGMISKTTKGIDDFTYEWNRYYHYEQHQDIYLGPQGWLFDYTGFSPDYNGFQVVNDQLPDVFNASAPGLDLSFIHNSMKSPYHEQDNEGVNQNGVVVSHAANTFNRNPFILNSDNSYTIQETYGNVAIGMWGVNTTNGATGTFGKYWYNDGQFNANYSINCINNIKIKSQEGYEYTFDKIESSQYLYDRDVDNDQSDDPFTVLSDVNITSYRLSKIMDLKTGKSVEFQYETYSQSFSEIIDNSTDYVNSGTNSDQKGLWLKYPKLNRLTKIIFDKGTIDFSYNLNRDDVTGEKALTNITLYDKRNNQIKKMDLSFDYYQSTQSTASPFSKRLRLKEVSMFGATNVSPQKYTLTYNSTPLPLRALAISDFFGYYNGETDKFGYNFSTNEYVNLSPYNLGKPKPTLYFNPNNGQSSFSTFSLSGSSNAIQGNYSLLSNLNYCKAGVLEKIEYPMGGYISLDYELNSFKLNGQEFSGGGLRVKNQQISDGVTARTLHFNYSDNSQTSGYLAGIPKFLDFIYNGPTQYPLPSTLTSTQFNSWFGYERYNVNKANIELTNGAYIGYSKVKVYEQNKGYTIYEYSNPNSNPNTSADMIISSVHFQNPISNHYKKIYYDNGKLDLFFDNDIFRGKLIKESIYDQSNILLKNTDYQYTSKEFNKKTVFAYFKLIIPDEYGSNDPTIGEPSSQSYQYGDLKQRRNLLTNVIETEYFNGIAKTKSKSYVYDNNYSLVKAENITDNLNTYRNEYYYPFDANVQNDYGMSDLLLNHRKGEKVLTYNFKNNEKLLEEKVYYGSYTQYGYKWPQLAKKYKSGSSGNANEIKSAEATVRDEFGNICEITDNIGNKTSFIWGYNKTEIVAKIENVGYSTIQTSVVTAIQNASNTGTENDLLGQLDNLRSTLSSIPNAMISTYTYKPLIGVSTITDVRQDKIIYLYDDFGRLKSVKDKNNNILSENEYNIKPQK